VLDTIGEGGSCGLARADAERPRLRPARERLAIDILQLDFGREFTDPVAEPDSKNGLEVSKRLQTRIGGRLLHVERVEDALQRDAALVVGAKALAEDAKPEFRLDQERIWVRHGTSGGDGWPHGVYHRHEWIGMTA